MVAERGLEELMVVCDLNMKGTVHVIHVKFWIRDVAFRFHLRKGGRTMLCCLSVVCCMFLYILSQCFQEMEYLRTVSAENLINKYSSWLGPENSLIANEYLYSYS